MDYLRYRVQPEGSKFVVYAENVYDNGRVSTPIRIDAFDEKYLADKFIEKSYEEEKDNET